MSRGQAFRRKASRENRARGNCEHYYLALLFEYPPANRATTLNSRESQSSRTLSLVGICVTLILAKLLYNVLRNVNNYLNFVIPCFFISCYIARLVFNNQLNTNKFHIVMNISSVMNIV